MPDYRVDFPALFVAVDWVGAHCVVPDGFDKGQPLELVDWQAWCLLNFYRVRREASVGQLAPAFHYRRSQVVLPQKAGKAPYTAAHICVEAVGPALFAGWAEGGERWDCRTFGCGCGWVYEYQPGEPMGQPWPTPLIQITATSEEQTDNIYDALRPMIDAGPLHEVIPKTGEEFIRLPNDGRIDVVTSSATSRLGQRVTFVPQDETGLWTKQNRMVRVAETQRRGLAGMGGRAEETTNAWDPSEQSVAQRTAEAETGDIFRHHPLPPSGLSYRNKAERRKIHRVGYAGSWWVDLDSIEAEAAELLAVDPAQAERFFGNRIVAGQDQAFDPDRWAELASEHTVPERSWVTLGFDGARYWDATAIVGTEVHSGFQWLHGLWERPETAAEDWEVPAAEVDASMVDAFDRFRVWRAYCDPPYWESTVDSWKGRWGEKRVIPWLTNRNRAMAGALRGYRGAQTAGEVTHDGNPDFARHIGNARRRAHPQMLDDDHRPMWTIQKDAPGSGLKIDAAMAGCLSWEARGDAVASGECVEKKLQVPRRLR